jgi:HEPN domain-containing protein
MKALRPLRFVPLMGGLLLAACDDGGPTGPNLESLTLEEQLTLEVLADPTTAEVALALATTQTGAAHRRGRAWSPGEDITAQAEHQFRNAEQAFAQGDLVRAMERHREGRRLVAQAMEGAGGPRALGALVERLESLPVTVAADPDGFHDPQGFGVQMAGLAEGARNAYRKGNRIRAGEMGVLAEQAVRLRQRDQTHALAGNPELKVELGAQAVALAERILGEEGTADERMDFLEVAKGFQSKAEESLLAGELRWAAHYAHLAQWWALKAVVLPDGVTEEEIEALQELAQTLFDDASAAVESDPTELKEALLQRAARLLEAGRSNQNNGTCRGLGALWQSAVISAYLVS